MAEPRRQNPAYKKAIAYTRDRRVEVDDPHLFRRNRPLHKALANQAYRARVRQLLGRSNQDLEDMPVDPVRRKRPRIVDYPQYAADLERWVHAMFGATG